MAFWGRDEGLNLDIEHFYYPNLLLFHILLGVFICMIIFTIINTLVSLHLLL